MKQVLYSKIPLLKSLISLSFLNATGSLLSYLITIQVARTLKPDIYGDYANVLVFASFLMILIIFGTEQTSSFFHKKGYSISSVARMSLTWKFSVFSLILLYLFIDDMIYDVKDFFIVAATVGNISLSNVYELSNRNERFLFIIIIEKTVYALVMFFLIYFNLLSLNRIFLLLFFTSVFSLLYQMLDNRRFLNGNVLKYDDYKYMFRLNLPLVILSVSMYVYGGFSRMFIESSLGSRSLGLYSAAWQFVTMASIFQSQVTRVWRIRLTDAIVNLDRRALIDHLVSYIMFSTFPSFILGLTLFYFGDYLVCYVYGNEYTSVVEVFKYFGFYCITIGFSILSDILWVGTGKSTEYVAINVVTAAVVLTIYITMQDRMTLLSFAITTVASHSIATILSLGLWSIKYFKDFNL